MPVNTENKFPDTELQSRAKKLFETNDNVKLITNWKSQIVEEILNGWLGKAVKLDDESLPVRIAHRQIENKDVFFIMNDSGKALSTRVTLNAPSKMEEWDPASGSIHDVSNSFTISLLPYHAKIYRSK